jgi:hypothetical protein
MKVRISGEWISGLSIMLGIFTASLVVVVLLKLTGCE